MPGACSDGKPRQRLPAALSPLQASTAMEAMYLLIAISLVFVVGIGVAFWWAIFAGQFDDSDAAGKSILHDEDTKPSASDAADRQDRANRPGDTGRNE